MNETQVQDPTSYLPKYLQSALDTLFLKNYSEIQLASFRCIPSKSHIMAQSFSGSGKTLAFLSICFGSIFTGNAAQAREKKIKNPQVLILAPTREVAMQINSVLLSIIENIEDEQTRRNIRSRLLIGGQGRPQEDALDIKEGSFQIIVGTLGRVQDVLHRFDFLKHIKVLVLDEADHLIRSTLKKKRKEKFQEKGRNLSQIIRNVAQQGRVLLYSATYSQETQDKVVELLGQNLEKIKIQEQNQEDQKDDHKHFFEVFTPTQELSVFELKVLEILSLLNTIKDKFEQVLLFYNHKAKGEELATELRSGGWNSIFIHGSQWQEERIELMQKIRAKKARVILSTDLLARGIDIPSIDLVINFDVPPFQSQIIHRVGRTGRFGTIGTSLTCLTQEEYEVQKEIWDSTRIKLEHGDHTLIKEWVKQRQSQKQKQKDLDKPNQDMQKQMVVPHNRDYQHHSQKYVQIMKRKKFEHQSKIGEWKNPDQKILYDQSQFKYLEEQANGEDENNQAQFKDRKEEEKYQNIPSIEEEIIQNRQLGKDFNVQELTSNFTEKQKEEFQIFKSKINKLSKHSVEMRGIINAMITNHFAEFQEYYEEACEQATK